MNIQLPWFENRLLSLYEIVTRVDTIRKPLVWFSLSCLFKRNDSSVQFFLYIYICVYVCARSFWPSNTLNIPMWEIICSWTGSRLAHLFSYEAQSPYEPLVQPVVKPGMYSRVKPLFSIIKHFKSTFSSLYT